MANAAIALPVGIISLGIGGAVGYFLTKKYLEEEYSRKADEEIASTREFLRKKYRGGKSEEKSSDKPEEDEGQLDISEETQRDLPKDPRESKNAQVAYNKVIDKTSYYSDSDEIDSDVSSDEEEEDSEEDEREEEFKVKENVPAYEVDKNDPDRLEPFLIDEEDWWINEKEHSQSSLVYYINDDILIDETSQVIYDQGDIVGDTIGIFDKNRDLYVIYVRNNRIHADIEVIAETDPYEGEL